MHMETTTIKTTTTDRRSAVNGLAVVGFIVLIIIGMALAIYAARFVPTAISRVGSAAVYLSSQVFSPNGDADGDLVVIPDDETIPFGNETATSTATSTVVIGTDPVFPTTPSTPSTPVTVTIPVQVPASYNYTGLADLTVTDVKTGYLRTTETSSFRESNEVPDGERGAVKFTIVNTGTNIAGKFDFDFDINTSPKINKNYKVTRELRPQERIEYTLWFDRVSARDDRTITIKVDAGDDVNESNERNNERTVSIDIER